MDSDELTAELVRTLEEDTFREAEIARTVKSAYQTITTAEEPENSEILPAKSDKVQKSTIRLSENENPAEKEDEIIGEELREHTPTFPDEVYDQIPTSSRNASPSQETSVKKTACCWHVLPP